MSVLGDPGRLRQILVNLIGNAIKFTDRGEVVLRVDVAAGSDRKDLIQFTISDTGIGIPESKLGSIFDAFSQEDSSITRRYGGTGLGLTISAKLVDALGGRIQVESAVGHGSQFHFLIPLERDVQSPEVPQDLTQLAGLRILLADDNRVNRRVLVRMLQGVGAQVLAVNTGEAAWSVMMDGGDHGVPFDLVLLDSHMPGIDGFTAAQRISAQPLCARVPLVMLSSAGLSSDAQRSREVGFSAYLSKPFTRDELMQVVLRAVSAQPARSVESVARHMIRDQKAYLDILLVEDHVVNQQLATTLLTHWGHRVTLAENGQLALDALAQHRFDLVLMDMMMPVMDGMTATRLFRATEKGRRMPIVAMTANARQDDRESCIVAGMDDYISKPIDTAELQRLLRRYISGDEPKPLVHGVDELARVVSPTLTASDFDYDFALAGADQEVVEIIAEVFVDQWPKDRKKMALALAGEDLNPLLHVAHALKGTLAMFGAQPAVERAQGLELLAARGELAGLAECIDSLATEVDQLIAALRRTVNFPTMD